MAEERRPTINMPQVAASALAAVSSAVVLSTLGVVGTIVGTALGSVVLTTGNAVYSHYINRSKERVDQMLKERGTEGVIKTFAPVRRAGHASRADSAETVEQGATEAGSPADGDETARIDPGGETRRFDQDDSTGEFDQDDSTGELHQADDTQRLGQAENARQLGDADRTEELHPAGDTGRLEVGDPADGTSRMDAVPEDTPGAGRGRSFWARFPWRRTVIAAAAVFLGVLAVITVFEFATGRTLADTVQGNTEMRSNPSIFGGTSGEETSDVDVPEDGEDPEAPAPPPATEDPEPDDPTQPEPEQEPDPDTPEQPTEPDPMEEPTEPEPTEDPDPDPDPDSPPEDGNNPDEGGEEPGAASE